MFLICFNWYGNDRMVMVTVLKNYDIYLYNKLPFLLLVNE